MGRATLMALVALVYGIALLRSGLFEFDARAFLSATAGSVVMGVVVFLALTLAHSFLLQLAMLPIVVVAGTLIYLGSLRAFRLLTVRDLEFVRDLTPTRLQVLLPAVARFVGLPWKGK